MTRPARRFQPSLDVLDKKTLLSAGPLTHLAATPDSPNDTKYYEWLDVYPGVFKAVMRWDVYGVPFGKSTTELLGHGENIKVPNAKTNFVRIHTDKPTASQSALTFIIYFHTDSDPKKDYRNTPTGASWTSDRTPPQLPAEWKLTKSG